MTQTIQTKIERFLDWAQQRVSSNDRGTLADLRRGFSPGTANRCWPYIARYCDLARDRERIIWQTIAAGFATHGATVKGGNLGTTMRLLALDGSTGTSEDALKSFDGRFRRLLTCDNAVELCEHLPGIIKAAKAKNSIFIDYERLFSDLLYWGDHVKLRWASAYWGEIAMDPEGGEPK